MLVRPVVLVLCVIATAVVAGCGPRATPTAPPAPPSSMWSAHLCDDIVFAASFVEHKLPAHVYCVNANGSGLRPLTQIGHPLDAPDHWEIRPRWSPDGARIAYADEAGVFVLHLHGMIPRRVASWEDGGVFAGWSPGGDRLLFWVRTDSRYVVSDFFQDAIVELRVVNEDGTGPTTIAKGMFLDSMSSVLPAHAEWRPHPGD